MNLLMVPSLLVGTLFGVLLQVILPSWIVMILFILVIGESFIKTFRNALKIRKFEIKEMK